MTGENADILDALPHRPPFRFLTEIVHFTERESGEAVWRVSGDEAFFAGHFPGQPIVPGVLIAEALAQLSGLVAFLERCDCGDTSEQSKFKPLQGRLANIDVRFSKAVTPPAEIMLRSRLDRVFEALGQCTVEARVGDKIVARGRVTVACPPAKEQEPA